MEDLDKWLKVVESLDVQKIKAFRDTFINRSFAREWLQLGLIKSAEIGKNYLINHFITNEGVDVNCECLYKQIKVTPLLKAIEEKRNDAVKYLIFMKADIHQRGQYGNALVTAVHFECSPEIITLILEKGAELFERHRDWPTLNLREYCVQLNKVHAKAAIDNYVFKLIARGDYKKLRSLADNGYYNINVRNKFGKTGRDLAIERCHLSIIKLIDKIELKQKRIRTKMNY